MVGNALLLPTLPGFSCAETVGDSIHPATGAQVLHHDLLQIHGVLPISFSIEYHSLLLKKGVLGHGWEQRQVRSRLEILPNTKYHS